MTKRSKWCEFDKDERKYIKKRDKEMCVVCGNKGALQIMHIFLNRSHGGKGDRTNGCLGCVKCHRIIDNPIGTEENKISKIYLQKCKDYLIEVEKIENQKELIENLKYKKGYIKIEYDINKINKVKTKNRCKGCKYLIKNHYKRNGIPNYYCRYRHILIHKTTEACKCFKSIT